MFKLRKLLLIYGIFILLGCAKIAAKPSETTTPENANEQEIADLLILDGKPYVDSKGKVYRKDEAHLVTSLNCYFSPDADIQWHSFEGMEQLVNLESLIIYGDGDILNTLDFFPLVSLSKLKRIDLGKGVLNKYNFNGIKQLTNLKYLEIEEEGDSLTNIDFSTLTSLPELREIKFKGQITRLPDLTKLTNLHAIVIGNIYYPAMLESLEGIGAPNVREIWINSEKEIDSFAPLNNLVHLDYLEFFSRNSLGEKEYKIADMANLPNLKHLRLLIVSKIDLRGIEKLFALEELWLMDCEPFNIEGIGKLSNLKSLGINLISPEPSLEFLRGIPKISRLTLGANEMAEGRLGYPHMRNKAYQILDMSPLATLKHLEDLQCRNFIIKNISTLDNLTFPFSEIDLISSRLFDETEKSKHNLVFESHKE